MRWERLANLSYKVVDDHGWACGWVPADAMNRHIDSECHLRVEPCPAHCGQILFVGKMEVHLAACPRKIQPCPLECGMHMEARFLEDHVAVRESEGMTPFISHLFCPPFFMFSYMKIYEDNK